MESKFISKIYAFKSEVGITHMVSKHSGLTQVLSVIEVRIPVVSVKRFLYPHHCQKFYNTPCVPSKEILIPAVLSVKSWCWTPCESTPTSEQTSAIVWPHWETHLFSLTSSIERLEKSAGKMG